jgi:5-methylcytosine-specific restriction protein A
MNLPPRAKPTYTPQRDKTAERGYDADWRRVRLAVLARDQYLCQIRTHCGGELATEVDHIRPVSEYPEGRLDPENLQAACKSCNSAKGARFPLNRKE